MNHNPPTSPVSEHSARKRAVLFMLLSSLSFAFMGAAVKVIPGIPVVQKVFFRNFIILIVISFSLAGQYRRGAGRELFLGHRSSRGWLLLRSLSGLVGVICYFYTISRLNLADASMLARLSPFFVTIFAAAFLREKITRIQIPALILAFSGALLIIKPRFDLSILPAVTGLASAVTAAGAYTIIRYLRGRENPDTVIFWFASISCLAMGIPTVINWVSPDGFEWFALLGVGLFSAGGQFFLTRAYQHAPAGEISIYNYTNILFSLILGLIFFSEWPDFLSLAGGGLIVLTALGLFLSGRK